MANSDLLGASGDAFSHHLPSSFAGAQSTWDVLQEALSQVTSDPCSAFGFVTIDRRIQALHDQGYDYAEIFVVALQQLVQCASPHEVSEPFRAAMSSLLVHMRATIDKSFNVR